MSEPYIPTHTLDQIQEEKIDLGYSHYRYIDTTDLCVPQLEAYLQICKDHNKKAYIEIKQPSRPDINGSAYDGPYLEQHDIRELFWSVYIYLNLDINKFAFMAFDQRELQWIHSLFSSVECYQLLATSNLYFNMTGRSYISDIASDEYS
ncbi:hypothetical protein FACS1894218_3250 [Bacilli bacterium]|nr:hypothetical protein FACS1894218_3250 [Bacilli bacterium]